MPKFTPSVLISDCWGSVGDLTFYHVDGRCYYKKKSQCEFPGTDAQNSQLDVHRRALAAWRTLEHSVQLTWNALAEPVISHKPPFDNTAHISGQNLFVSAYHGFYTLGDEHVPYPQAWQKFPVHSLDFEDAAVDGSDLRLCFHSYFPETEHYTWGDSIYDGGTVLKSWIKDKNTIVVEKQPWFDNNGPLILYFVTMYAQLNHGANTIKGTRQRLTMTFEDNYLRFTSDTFVVVFDHWVFMHLQFSGCTYAYRDSPWEGIMEQMPDDVTADVPVPGGGFLGYRPRAVCLCLPSP